MTSMLFSVSIAYGHGGGRSPRRASSLLLRGFFDVLAHHVLVGGKPVGHLLELPTLHLPDLNETATFVVGRRDLERRDQNAQGEVQDLIEPGPRVLPGELAAGACLRCAVDRPRPWGGRQHAA